MLRCSLMFPMLLSDTGATLISGGQRLRGGSEGRTNSGQITVYYGHCSARAAGADHYTSVKHSDNATSAMSHPARRRHHHQASIYSKLFHPLVALVSFLNLL